jgi:hypothetical protein
MKMSLVADDRDADESRLQRCRRHLCHQPLQWNDGMSPETLKVTLSKIFFPVRFNKLMNIAALFFSRPASVEPAQHLNMISVLFSNGNNN